MNRSLIWGLMGAMLAFGVGCSSSDENGGTAGTGGTGGSAGEVDFCAANSGSGNVDITVEEITEDTYFSNACSYTLTRKTYVIGSTMRIQEGTEFFGAKDSALIVTTSGDIDAVGTAADPIVFTSSRAERLAGDWGGVVLLGLAKLSWGNTPCNGVEGNCEGNIEGLPNMEDRGIFGGNNDSHDCGTLKYVRIEYAGNVIGLDNELNGLSVGGCGDQTELSYIQVHRGLDDGVEFFGGTAAIDHVIVTGTGDDGVDWDQGYRGSIENFIVHHFSSSTNDPNGIEADNYKQDFDAQPRSAPSVLYGTIVSSEDKDTSQGIVNRRGTFGVMDGLVVSGFGSEGYDMRDSAWNASGGWGDGIVVQNTCFWQNDPDYPIDENCELPDENPAKLDCDDSDGEAMASYFAEDTELAEAALGNSTDENPMLGDFSGAATGGDPDYSVGSSNCMGAFAPGGTDWTTGWTDYSVE